MTNTTTKQKQKNGIYYAAAEAVTKVCGTV
jgi:hypothetical protein